jgi:hypothetical protein
MIQKRLFTCFVVAGLVSVPAASVPAGSDPEGAAAPATAVSTSDSSDADGAALRAGGTCSSKAQAQAAIRDSEHSKRDVAAPSGARPSWKAAGGQGFVFFGASVATAGDVNGDGYDDVVVGAFFYNNDEVNQGRAFVYHGSTSGLSATADWTAEGDQAGARFGVSVGNAGDVNGDGYDDVVIGESHWNYGPLVDMGRAFVYHGSASGLSATADWIGRGDQVGALFGGSVGTAGDINGDGYDDVIVGARLYNGIGSEVDEGQAFVYHGSASGLSSTPDWRGESNQNGALFGVSVGTAGDVNGDGYDDVVVGAFNYDGGSGCCEEGRAFVYHGSASGLSTTADWMVEGDQGAAHLGISVATAGDVNGDGYDDVVVGAPNYDNGQDDEGRAFVYHGSASGLSTTPDWTAEGNQVNAEFGWSVGTTGDVNGDGYDDVLVGARFYDHGLSGVPDEGRAFVYFGSASGLSATATAHWMAESDQVDARFGSSVGTAGDVNGDGYDDGIGGAPLYEDRHTNEGVAVVFHGRGTAAAPRQPDWSEARQAP